MFKKYIDELTLKDVPQNGVIVRAVANEKGELIKKSSGCSNIPLAFEKDEALANLNGYYRYVEEPEPEYDESVECILSKYILEDNIIVKKHEVISIDVENEKE